MAVKDLEFYEQETLADESIREFIEEEIAHTPMATDEVAEHLAAHHAASPADSGGNLDAEWEDVNASGAEAVFSHNPSPDQSSLDASAHAMGIDYEDNEPIDVVRKLEKRDRDRFELNENSKSTDDMI